MTVEAILTRALEITFIDARKLALEAKLEKNIVGYPSNEQQTELVSRAIEIFESKPERDQVIMKQIKKGLESCKIKNGSLSSSMRSNNDASSSMRDDNSSSNGSDGEYKSYMRRAGSNDGLNRGSNHSRKSRNRINRNGSGGMLFSNMRDGMRRIASSGSTGYLRRLARNSSNGGSNNSLKSIDSLHTGLQKQKQRRSGGRSNATKKVVDIDKLLLSKTKKKQSMDHSSNTNVNVNPASEGLLSSSTTSASTKANFTWDTSTTTTTKSTFHSQ